MREGIHPNYKQTVIKCACGTEYLTGSTREKIHVEICSACHPFFTGKQKLVDTAGRVEKFHKRMAKKTTVRSKKIKDKTEKTEKKVKESKKVSKSDEAKVEEK